MELFNIIFLELAAGSSADMLACGGGKNVCVWILYGIGRKCSVFLVCVLQ